MLASCPAPSHSLPARDPLSFIIDFAPWQAVTHPIDNTPEPCLIKLIDNLEFPSKARWPLDSSAPFLKGPGLKI